MPPKEREKEDIRNWFNKEDCMMIDVDKVDGYTSAWGNTFTAITEEDIELLRQGKVLYIDDGEYGHFIRLATDEEVKNDNT